MHFRILSFVQMARGDSRKFRSIKRRKRSGFFGRRKREVAHTLNNNNAVVDEGPYTSSSVTGTTTQKSPRDLVNKSSQSY